MAKLGYTWYPKDFISDPDVMLMTSSERGIYRDLIDLAYMNNNVIKYSLDALARYCNGTVHEIEKILLWKGNKIGDFWEIPNCQKRIDLAIKNRENGGKGGRPKKPKENPNNNPNDNPNDNHNLTQSKRQREREREREKEREKESKREIENNTVKTFSKLEIISAVKKFDEQWAIIMRGKKNPDRILEVWSEHKAGLDEFNDEKHILNSFKMYLKKNPGKDYNEYGLDITRVAL